MEEHREKGGDPEVDVAYQYLQFFMDDDAELARLKAEYKSGKLLTGEVGSPLALRTYRAGTHTPHS